MTSALLNGFQFSARNKEEAFWNHLGFQLGGVYSHYSNDGIKINNPGLNNWYIIFAVFLIIVVIFIKR